MAEFIPVPPFDLVVFGATGDLSLRKLFPSLLHRFLDGQIPPQSRIIGVARSDMDTAAFRKMVHEGHLKFDPKSKIDATLTVEAAKKRTIGKHAAFALAVARYEGFRLRGPQPGSRKAAA
jgi:glucose-6-phosphate 1-dehydrogenase